MLVRRARVLGLDVSGAAARRVVITMSQVPDACVPNAYVLSAMNACMTKLLVLTRVSAHAAGARVHGQSVECKRARLSTRHTFACTSKIQQRQHAEETPSGAKRHRVARRDTEWREETLSGAKMQDRHEAGVFMPEQQARSSCRRSL
jgi:hypothetical protein